MFLKNTISFVKQGEIITADDIFGILKGGGVGPTVAVMGELDSVIVPGHPHADPETNRVNLLPQLFLLGNDYVNMARTLENRF